MPERRPAFLVSNAGNRTFRYCNTTVRKDGQNDESLRFVEEFRRETGTLPGELVFYSGLTTHANLAELDRLGIRFMTLRRRSKAMMEQLQARSAELVDRFTRRKMIENQTAEAIDFNVGAGPPGCG